jgi:2-oxoisovalerate ferredoxin oxidoreductase beta subunit
MAKTIAQLDGPIYVERVALFNAQQRTRAHKAIKKALRLQVENRGLGFVEVLSECPLHLDLTPAEAERWVEEKMVPAFPLGVKKDLAPEPWFALGRPEFDPERLVAAIGGGDDPARRLSGGAGPAPRFAGGAFPAHLDREDVAVKFAGAGGDGAQTIAALVAKAGIAEGFDATYIPSYGPESRGGTSYADVHLATGEVLSPAAPDPHLLVAFNLESLAKFGPRVRAGGVALYDETVIPEPPELPPGVRRIGVPASAIALALGTLRVKNVVALGALVEATRLLPAASVLAGLRASLRDDCALLALNEAAFERGAAACREAEATVN